jgi:23S rRNA pseudouridine1911/1915/1917 synthase
VDDTRAERLDARVAREFGLSRRAAREAIEAGQVDVDGAPATQTAAPARSGQRVAFDPNRKKRKATRFSVPVAYADEHVVVVDKPAGLLTVPTDGRPDEDCVLNRVRGDLLRARGGRPYVGALHRLDRGTSGLVALALSREAHARGRGLFRRRAFSRTYLALVKGIPSPASGVVDVPIGGEYRDGRRRVADGDDDGALDAVTRYRVVERFHRLALVELTLETGRQHQIRLHMQHIGHPIVGDVVYRSDRDEGRAPRGGRPLLHAARLSFEHPATGRRVSVSAPLPRDFDEAIARARRAT